MSVPSSQSLTESGASPEDPGPSPREPRLGRLLATLVAAATVLFLFWTALQSVFLALQVQRIDARGAAGGLAYVVGLGAVGALVSAPIAGALSDRTRTRIGGRAPWMLVGAAATLVLSLLASSAGSITQLAIYWLLIQVATNFVFTPITVHIPERVPLGRRGMFSAALGLSHLAGAFLGQAVGSALAQRIFLGYVIVSSLLVLSVVLFVIVNRRDNRDMPRPPFSLVALAKAFWVNPLRHRAFGWAFLGRLLLFTGYFPLTAYTLYLLQDYAHLGDAAVLSVPALGLAGLAGSAVGTPLVGLLGDRFRVTRPLIYVCAAVMVIGILLPLAMPTLTGMLVFTFLVGAGFGGYGSVDYVLITKVLPSNDDVGKDLGIINMTTTLSQTVGVAVAGSLVSAIGDYSVLFVLAAVLVGLGAGCIAFVRTVR